MVARRPVTSAIFRRELIPAAMAPFTASAGFCVGDGAAGAFELRNLEISELILWSSLQES
ncbi:hypothetical protein CLAC_05535 [Corynebacterium lactis RW2-5]|uniref:Uncharacterized protein n=1 Tax=Corynebacterium lactis RW2-5 TaxID=1408189 RepID=A0A0K2H469_9CORY|nr:hypothetical protein CLAC_05535 [Corynebacterium lactis RW2-5]